MCYKRNETFRFKFDAPLHCSFKIVEIDHQIIHTGFAIGEIIDLSPHGLKLSSNLNIPFGNHEVKLDIKFKINDAFIETVGILVWRKEIAKDFFQYGIQFVNPSEMYEIITEELKSYVQR